MKAKTLIASSLLLASSGFSATPLHHYAFDGSGVVDSVGTANGMLLNGAAVGSGRLSFDGINDYVQFGENLIPITGSFSVSFFAQQALRQTYYAEIISQGRNNGPGFFVGYDLAHNIRVGDLIQNTGVPYPNDGLAHHFAVISAPSVTSLFIDGRLSGTFGPISIASGGDFTRLGAQFDSWGEFFRGDIDDLWVFSGALTSDEIAILAAPPRLTISSIGDLSHIQICWNSRLNIMYQVQYSSDLTPTSWVDFGSAIPGNGTVNCVTDTVRGGFYRLLISLAN